MQGISAVRQDSSAQVLEPVLGKRWVLNAWQALTAMAIACSFLIYSYCPLNPSEIWTHVGQGVWNLENTQLSTSDPMLSLADGMPWTNDKWLSQVILAAAYKNAGAEGLSALFAVLATTIGVSWFVLFRRITGRIDLAVAGWMTWTVATFPSMSRFGPIVFGSLCLALLMNLICFRPYRSTKYIICGLLFVVWANLHTSFLVGIIVLLAFFLGQAIDVHRRTHSLSKTFRNTKVKRWLVLFEVAAVCSLINPYGFGLWLKVFNLPQQMNAAEMWRPLILHSFSGMLFATSLLAVVIAVRTSTTPIKGREALLVICFALLAGLHQPLMVWYVPMVLFVVLPRFARVLPHSRHAKGKVERPLSAVDFRYSLITALAIWTVFALSPVSNPVLGGKPRTEPQLLGKMTPLGAAEYFEQTPTHELVWAPVWWSGWLKTHANVSPFATHQLENLPQLALRDYWRIAHTESGWSRILDRYGVHALVIDRERQAPLEKAAKKLDGWHVAFEDEQCVVVVRHQTTSGSPQCQTLVASGLFNSRCWPSCWVSLLQNGNTMFTCGSHPLRAQQPLPSLRNMTIPPSFPMISFVRY